VTTRGETAQGGWRAVREKFRMASILNGVKTTGSSSRIKITAKWALKPGTYKTGEMGVEKR